MSAVSTPITQGFEKQRVVGDAAPSLSQTSQGERRKRRLSSDDSVDEIAIFERQARSKATFFALLLTSEANGGKQPHHEAAKGEHNLTMKQCCVTQSKLRLTFLSYKHIRGRPFALDVHHTDNITCPQRLLNEYI